MTESRFPEPPPSAGIRNSVPPDRTVLTARVEDLPAQLRDIARAVRVEGEVVRSRPETGEVRIRTEAGDIIILKIRAAAEKIPAEGQKIEIVLPPGKPPRQVEVRTPAPQVQQPPVQSATPPEDGDTFAPLPQKNRWPAPAPVSVPVSVPVASSTPTSAPQQEQAAAKFLSAEADVLPPSFFEGDVTDADGIPVTERDVRVRPDRNTVLPPAPEQAVQVIKTLQDALSVEKAKSIPIPETLPAIRPGAQISLIKLPDDFAYNLTSELVPAPEKILEVKIQSAVFRASSDMVFAVPDVAEIVLPDVKKILPEPVTVLRENLSLQGKVMPPEIQARVFSQAVSFPVVSQDSDFQAPAASLVLPVSGNQIALKVNQATPAVPVPVSEVVETPVLISPVAAGALLPLPLAVQQDFGIGKPVTTDTVPQAEPKLVEARVLSIFPPPPVISAPEHTGQVVSSFSGENQEKETLILKPVNATGMIAKITGNETKAPQTMTVFLPGSDVPASFALDKPSPTISGASALTEGTEIHLVPAPSAATVKTAPVAPALLPYIELLPGQPWPAMEEFMRALEEAAPRFVQTLSQTSPNAAAPGRIPAAALLFSAAVRAGDISGWLGEKAIDVLRRAGKAEVIEKMTRSFSSLSRMASEPAAQDWRAVSIPMFWQGDVHKMMLYYRHDVKDDETEETGREKVTRFIFDLSLPRMGGVQLDGFHRTKKLDLIVRTAAPLSLKMQAAMRSAYGRALEQAGVSGEMAFQGQAAQFVKIEPAINEDYVIT